MISRMGLSEALRRSYSDLNKMAEKSLFSARCYGVAVAVFGEMTFNVWYIDRFYGETKWNIHHLLQSLRQGDIVNYVQQVAFILHNVVRLGLDWFMSVPTCLYQVTTNAWDPKHATPFFVNIPIKKCITATCLTKIDTWNKDNYNKFKRMAVQNGTAADGKNMLSGLLSGVYVTSRDSITQVVAPLVMIGVSIHHMAVHGGRLEIKNLILETKCLLLSINQLALSLLLVGPLFLYQLKKNINCPDEAEPSWAHRFHRPRCYGVCRQ